LRKIGRWENRKREKKGLSFTVPNVKKFKPRYRFSRERKVAELERSAG
jgi:hypothetical protein